MIAMGWVLVGRGGWEWVESHRMELLLVMEYYKVVSKM
jgi:hypothetical protein